MEKVTLSWNDPYGYLSIYSKTYVIYQWKIANIFFFLYLPKDIQSVNNSYLWIVALWLSTILKQYKETKILRKYDLETTTLTTNLKTFENF